MNPLKGNIYRLAFEGTGQELGMEQHSNRFKRDDYWQTMSERFNSADFSPVF